MNEKKAAAFFDKDSAATYDKQRASLTPIKDALFLLTRMVLSDLPAQANILCVGVGTGAELKALAQVNPEWRFTLVEPAAAMMDICREEAEKLDLSDRCIFHEGYLHTLPGADPFDAATAMLVSHFLLDLSERRGFFTEIASRLRPDGWLVNADLSGDQASPRFAGLFDMWGKTMKHSGMATAHVEKICSFKGVSLLPTAEIEALLIESGFRDPTLFYQAGLMHGWCSKRSG